MGGGVSSIGKLVLLTAVNVTDGRLLCEPTDGKLTAGFDVNPPPSSSTH